MIDTPYHPTWQSSVRLPALVLWAALLPGCGSNAQAEPPAALPVEQPQADPAVAEADEAPAPAEVEAPRHYRVASKAIEVRSRPTPDAPLRGDIHAGHPFEVLAQVDGDGCAAGWWSVPSHGYVCAAHTETTTAPAKAQPELVTYDPPEPSEFAHYVETGEYDHGDPISIVPSVYAKRWKRFKGDLYADLDAWNASAKPSDRLLGGAGNKYHFTEILETERGPVLLRDDGQVAALDDVYLYPVSRLRGQDLEARPVPEGMMPAFAIGYDGTAVWATPEAPPIPADPADAVEPPLRLAYHSPLLVRAEPVAKGWYAVPDALGPGKDGYVNDYRGIRHPVAHEGRPSGVGDDEIWIDVELNQQVLQLWRGDELVWFTLVSTGAAPMGTPKGIFTITDKMATKTMRSRPDADAEDAYMVEDVPWTIHWKPAYAIHGAYWHWGFGRTASHGCINMAPYDVQEVWARIGPHIPDGWHTSWATAEVPGTVLQVRRRGIPTPDRRDGVLAQADGPAD